MYAIRRIAKLARISSRLSAMSLLVLTTTAAAGTSCPDNMIGVSRTDVLFVTAAPTASITWTEGEGDQVVPWDATQPCPEGCYDLPKGTVVARGWNYLYGPGDTFVSVSDKYVVTGPAGPPLAFEVVLQLDATIVDEGTADAGVAANGSASQYLQLTATGMTQTAVPILVAPGTTFEVWESAHAVGGRFGGTGLAVASIRFRGLPAGYAISSCQGFDRPTPTQSVTWGGVKAQYR